MDMDGSESIDTEEFRLALDNVGTNISKEKAK
jgi:hypothetical protein